jgi:hypothetical protein
MHTNRGFTRGLTTLALSATIVAGSGIAAWAHECSNVSRSAKGDAKAAAGNGWALISDIILMFGIPEELLRRRSRRSSGGGPGHRRGGEGERRLRRAVRPRPGGP